MGIGLRRSRALAAPVSQPSVAATPEGKILRLVCLSLVLAVAVLALRIASVL